MLEKMLCVVKMLMSEKGKVEMMIKVESLSDVAGSYGFVAYLFKDEYGVCEGW